MIRISNSNPADALRENGQLRIEIIGRSMRPLLKAGKNTVHLRYLTQDPHLLDVVLFSRNDGSFVLHRIISKNGDSYTLCGDNQILPEPGITRQQIIGRMEGYYTKDRYHSCAKLSYQLYSRLWCRVMLLRRLYVSLRHKLGGKST